MSVPAEHLLALAAFLFAIGVLGFLVRRNVIIVLASIRRSKSRQLRSDVSAGESRKTLTRSVSEGMARQIPR